MGTDLPAVERSSTLGAHADPDTEPASIGRNQLSRDACRDVAVEGLAVPVTGKGIVIGTDEALDRLIVDGDAAVHQAIGSIVMFH